MPLRIPVAEPVLQGNERKYVLDCLDSTWISGAGKYIEAFERTFAEFCGVQHAVAMSNGTVALHAALLALEIGPGDEVLVPDFTYIASVNAITYCGAKPVLVDVDPVTWTIDVEDTRRKITKKTRAILPVHIYGHPADMDPLLELGREFDLKILEDAAEAHGAEYQGKRVGSLGHLGTFSFFGNKIITTGEGGMVTTDDAELARKLRLLRGQGMDPKKRYWFPIIGYNYRMTNLQAALGLAQLERIDWFIERRREVASWYTTLLGKAGITLPPEAEWAKNVFWMYSICLPDGVDRDQVIADMEVEGIETRPFFFPMHVLPPYLNPKGDREFPVSTSIGRRGLNLPSSASLTYDDAVRVADVLMGAVASRSLTEATQQLT